MWRPDQMEALEGQQTGDATYVWLKVTPCEVRGRHRVFHVWTPDKKRTVTLDARLHKFGRSMGASFSLPKKSVENVT